MKKVWVAAFSFALCSFPAYAIDLHSHTPTPDSVCLSESEWKEILGKVAHTAGGVGLIVEGATAAKMLKTYNDIPPVGDIEAEEILITYNADSASFVFIHNGKGCGVRNLKSKYFFAWINTAFPHDPNAPPKEDAAPETPKVPYSVDPDYEPHAKDI